MFALLSYGAIRRGARHRVPDQQVRPEAQSSATTTVHERDAEVTPEPSAPPAARLSTAVAPPVPDPQVPSFAASLPPVVEPSRAPPPSATPPKSPAATAAPASPTPEQIHAALAATPIVMFTASWCSVCRRAHAFLRANGLSCTDRDIDAEPAALRELKRRTGSASVPTLEIDGELERPGFSERAVERALARSVERRLGVHGISVQR
jgi:glutaredoxin